MTSATELGIEGDIVHTSAGQGGPQTTELKDFGLPPGKRDINKASNLTGNTWLEVGACGCGCGGAGLHVCVSVCVSMCVVAVLDRCYIRQEHGLLY